MGFDALAIALREIRRNLLRAFLTVLGVVIGVAAVITMVTLGRGATAAVTQQIEGLGSNLVIARPARGMGPGGNRAPEFRLTDADSIAEQVDGVRAVAPITRQSVSAVYLQEDWSTQATGSTPAYFDVASWTLSDGRAFTEAEYRGARPVCVIGSTLVTELFGQQQPIGAEIRIERFACEVIGVLGSKGQGAMGDDQDDVVVMPFTTLERRLTGRQSAQSVNAILISASDDASIERVVSDATAVLRKLRGIRGSEDDDFSVFDTKQIAQALSSTTRVLTMLLGAVAAVSLVVGGIGIMNIMLVSVTERTREIGIRMAIGALPGEVLVQFLVEAVVLSAVGGLLGIALALGASYGLAQVMQVPFVFDPTINAIAFAFSAAVGVLFGFMPARRASRLDPIEALRHE